MEKKAEDMSKALCKASCVTKKDKLHRGKPMNGLIRQPAK
jgi:hypothetical protein